MIEEPYEDYSPLMQKLLALTLRERLIFYYTVLMGWEPEHIAASFFLNDDKLYDAKEIRRTFNEVCEKLGLEGYKR